MGLWNCIEAVQGLARHGMCQTRGPSLMVSQQEFVEDAEMFSQNMSSCQELFRVWKDEVAYCTLPDHCCSCIATVAADAFPFDSLAVHRRFSCYP